MKRRTLRQLAAKVPKEKKKGAWKKWLVLAPLLLLLAAFIYFVNLPKYQIEKVEVKGVLLTNESSIREAVLKEISGDYLFIVPKSYEWLYPRGKIRKKIEMMPSVLEATLDLDRKTQTLAIEIVERKQEYVWCAPWIEGEGSATRQCFYMDKDGLIFTKAPLFEGQVFLTFSGLIDPESPVGENFLPSKHMADLLEFIGNLRSQGLSVASVNAISTREVHIRLASGTDIIITLEESLETVTKSIKTLLQSDDFKNASGGINALSYIDLRYGSKAFWKER
jgi:cell division septal protein FtsQ